MTKKPKPRRKHKARMSTAHQAEDIRQIQRGVKLLDEGVYHVVYERPFRGVSTRFFLDVSEDTFRPSAWPCATLFKDERLARLIARKYSALRQRKLHVARVTIKLSRRRSGGRNKRRFWQ